ncbi:hypothetical protein KIH39_10530 [Telmatocola sphagniphila]|uniref:Glycosyltransferase RgtA/B/C/D-like domain-containing protein n=1 Tax=Telmatocola sphagniphila TaxID=1123043 RepID=A0A8E6F0A7_9BACT|nr:hypothetical protein [Telmatocola sphagniphila]QVL34316.1 hypothetical protein KIH39_10530 [Telmatocola sphagniphila]
MNFSIRPILAWFGAGALLLAILILGIPPYLRTPLWVDVSLYDIAAWNVLQGGVHYRDTLDTNPPGMMLLQLGIRSLLGWSSEAILAIDLLVITAILLLLSRLLKKSSLSSLAVFCFLITGAFFYIFESEYIHCQRDVWMLLPILVAINLYDGTTPRRRFLRAFLVGCAIGTAVCLKPHVLIPALGSYLWMRFGRRTEPTSDRGSLGRPPGFLGIFVGVVLVGSAMSCWLIASGSLAPMLDIFLNWNPEYYDWSSSEYHFRWVSFWFTLQPWSRLHAVAIPLAIFAIWNYRSREATATTYYRSLLAVLYLTWIAQAFLLQKSMAYIQAPGMILGIALVASYVGKALICVVFWVLISSHICGMKEDSSIGHYLNSWKQRSPATFYVFFPYHCSLDPERLELWSDCLKWDCPDVVRDKLPYFRDHLGVPSYVAQRDVVNFLKPLNLQEGQLVCWCDATFLIYRELNLKPAIRYLHVHTALMFQSKRDLIRADVLKCSPKYAVVDLSLPKWYFDIPDKEMADNNPEFPPSLPDFAKTAFPWDQKVVFRSGRYVVLEVTEPIDRIFWY